MTFYQIDSLLRAKIIATIVILIEAAIAAYLLCGRESTPATVRVLRRVSKYSTRIAATASGHLQTD